MRSDHPRTQDPVGSLTHRLRIEVYVSVPNGAGGFTDDWGTHCDRRGRITSPSRSTNAEGIDGGALESTPARSIRLRADPETRTITTEMRVRDRDSGTVYEIADVYEAPERDWIVLTCERVTGG